MTMDMRPGSLALKNKSWSIISTNSMLKDRIKQKKTNFKKETQEKKKQLKE